MTPTPFSLSTRAKSLAFAVVGIGTMFRTQPNAWLHLLASLVVVVAGLWFGLLAWEWCALVVAMTAVWVAEAMNTAVEFITDLASPELHPLAKNTKDVAAGAVLLAAFGSVAVGLLVFTPHMLALLRGAG